MHSRQYQIDSSRARLADTQMQGECKGSMDEAELKPEEADLARARRDYVWFAIILLCITQLTVIRSHS
jgi:hypothetical protein